MPVSEAQAAGGYNGRMNLSSDSAPFRRSVAPQPCGPPTLRRAVFCVDEATVEVVSFTQNGESGVQRTTRPDRSRSCSNASPNPATIISWSGTSPASQAIPTITAPS